MGAARVAAPAKLNLALEVLGRREDGFHEIDSVAASIGLADELTLTDAAARTIEYVDDGGRPASIQTDDDIVARAWRALADSAGNVPATGAVRIVKRIPIAAGLGGGSSDAAAFLRTANALWQLGLDDGELARIGATIGSDVPVCLMGGFARMRGRGERVEALADAGSDDAAAVLYTPEIPVPAMKTAAMYRALRPSHFGASGASERLVGRLARRGIGHESCMNAFDQVADEVMTGLRAARRRFAAGLAHVAIEHGIPPPTPLLAGAGPSLFAVLPVDAAEAAGVLLAERGIPARVCRFVPRPEVGIAG